MPARGLGQFEASPVLQTAKPLMQVEPMSSPLLDRMLRMGIDPMLERVDASNPGENVDDSFKMSFPGTLEILIARVKFFKLFASEQFHAHRSHFAEFNRRMAVVSQRLITSGEDAECMAGLVQEVAHIAVQPNSVHQEEGQPCL